MENRKYNWQLSVILFGVWTLLGLIFAGISYFAALGENRSVGAYSIFLASLGRFYLWALLSPLILQVVKHFDFGNPKKVQANLLAHLLLSFLFSILHTIIFSCLIWFLDESYRVRYTSLTNFFQQSVFFGSLYLGVLFYTLIVITFQSILLFRRYREEEARNLELRAELAQSQLQALKMQLQPHFLFNTLHSISSLNLVDPQKANTMISRLGEFLRMTLEHSGEQMVSLGEEMEFARCYLEIEQTRFSDRLTVEFFIEPNALVAEFPHLILQPIVENAIKFGLYDTTGDITISVQARKVNDDLIVTVRNPYDPQTAAPKKGTGFGLSSVQRRLYLLFARTDLLQTEAGKESFVTTIKIPQQK